MGDLHDRRAHHRPDSKTAALRRKNVWVPLAVLTPFYLIASMWVWATVGEPILLGAPQVMTHWELLDTEIKSGDPLRIKYGVKTTRVCRVRLDRWVSNAEIANLPPVGGTITKVGTVERVGLVQLPRFDPGPHEFWVRATHRCFGSLGHEYLSIRGPLRFTVIGDEK